MLLSNPWLYNHLRLGFTLIIVVAKHTGRFHIKDDIYMKDGIHVENNRITTNKEYTPEPKHIEDKTFSAFFDRLLKRLNDNKGLELKKKDIAQILGIGPESFRKIVNETQKASKRDCIIAICFVLEATAEEVNDALCLYQMPKLKTGIGDGNYLNHRDGWIWNYFNNVNEDDPESRRSIDTFSNELDLAGFEKLDIINHKKNTNNIKTDYPYTLIGKIVLTNFITPDTNLNYITMESIKYSVVRAAMEFDNNGNSIVIWVNISNPIDPTAKYFVYNESEKSCKVYSDIKETGKFEKSFKELYNLAMLELNMYNKVISDTKNFGKLMSVKVIDNDLHIFVETFNTCNDFLNKYYFMDYCNGEYKTFVSTNSNFMKKCVSEKYHGKFVPTYDYINNNRPTNTTHYTCDFDIYHNLSSDIKKLIALLLDEELPIGIKESDLFSAIYHYSLQNEFELGYKTYFSLEEYLEYLEIKIKDFWRETIDCKEEYDILDMEAFAIFNKLKENLHKRTIDEQISSKPITIGNERPTIRLSGGETVELTAQDLLDGIALGLDTVDEVGNFLLKHGTLKLNEIIHQYDYDI